MKNRRINSEGGQEFSIRVQEKIPIERGGIDAPLGRVSIQDMRETGSSVLGDELLGEIYRIEVEAEDKSFQKLRLHCSTGHKIALWVKPLPRPLDIITYEDIKQVFDRHVRRPMLEGEAEKVAEWIGNHFEPIESLIDRAVKEIWKC